MRRDDQLALMVFMAAAALTMQVFAQGQSGPQVMGADAYTWVIQGGSFALVVYIVFWTTRTAAGLLSRLSSAIEDNTSCIKQLDNDIRLQIERGKIGS